MQYAYLPMLAVGNSQRLLDRLLDPCREIIAAGWIQLQLKKLQETIENIQIGLELVRIYTR